MYKYILFDFDGTLIDTNEVIILALRQAAKKFLDRDLSADDLNCILGKYLEDQMRLLSQEHCSEMVLYYKELYKANQDSMTKEFPGIKQMLANLKNLGCKIAIVSAKGRGGIEHSLRLFELESYIDVIVSAYDVKNNKPHPEPALKALEMLGACASEALMIGDSPYDIMCGKNAQIKTALVDWSIFPKETLMELNPDYYINTSEELVEMIKKSSSNYPE